MPALKRTDEFDRWLRGLRDAKGKGKIVARVERLESGQLGDVAQLEEVSVKCVSTSVPDIGSISNNKVKQQRSFTEGIRIRSRTI
jgi:hypothetical protein